jgi:hypothetical protein
MIKRFVWFSIGFMLGLGSSWAVMRRVRRVAARYVPTEVVDRWSGNVKAAVSEGRGAYRARDDEWKASFARNAGQ